MRKLRTVLRIKLRGRRKANNGTPGQELADSCSNPCGGNAFRGLLVGTTTSRPVRWNRVLPGARAGRPLGEPIETAVIHFRVMPTTCSELPTAAASRSVLGILSSCLPRSIRWITRDGFVGRRSGQRFCLPMASDGPVHRPAKENQGRTRFARHNACRTPSLRKPRSILEIPFLRSLVDQAI